MELTQRALALWGDAEVVRIISAREETYLTTLVLALSALVDQSARQLSSAGASKKADKKALESAQRLSTLEGFSKGVAARLDHGSTITRHMGMLAAEIITDLASRVGAANSDDPNRKPAVKLDFGKSSWDGSGDGKEEARVLRAMVHGWPSDATLVEMRASVDPVAALGLDLPPQEAISHGQVIASLTATPAIATRRPPTATRQPPMVQLLDRTSSSKPNSAGSAAARKPLISSMSDDDASSSGSDSSDDEQSELKQGAAGLGAEGAGLTPAESAINKLPSERRQRVPVYIGELAPLLRQNDRSANRLGLHHAEPLLRKKAGWGGEIDENAVDLAFALVGMQNSFGIKSFNDLKTRALTALIIASPKNAAGATIEQFFNPQYSLEQRHIMLNSIAFAAFEMAGLQEKAEEDTLDKLATDLSLSAIGKAKAEGEAHVPAIQREKKLRMASSAAAALRTGSLTTRPEFPGALVRPSAAFVDVAFPCFLQPLITRAWASMEHASSRSGNFGAGAGAVFAPSIMSRLLDTLSVLAHAAKNGAEFTRVIGPELLELAIGANRILLPLAAAHQLYEVANGAEDASNVLSNSVASLLLSVLADLWEVDGGKGLLRHHNDLLVEVQDLLQVIFEREDPRKGRAARPAAAGILRIAEMRDSWRSSLM